ncbi:cell division suppressor protein YneA [Anaerotignum sp.]|uniref:cell division suppressor protein YneA n=1 Tax=Anaerotignum sp. TaxID=2039241 RepID=UPI002A919435|nr:LysM peptidoglycan-binding domain-containing protein [Anaerotignum sp.]MCI7657210.1 LysM peptidoglycan-binding domain-containing protein [Clostridia bacterium]MDY5416321.1 LysM peptidoglycan-binding domain-containing protein [Anaerotignum sp.]
MDGRKRRRMVRRSRKARKNFLILLTIVLVTGIGTIAMGAQTQKTGEVYYESVLIHSGDTLWDIAAAYKADGEKTEHMVDKIQKLNQMRSERIRAGERILVPVTKEAV